MEKKGLSPIIATVLLLLVTIAAVALIANFIIPFIKGQLKTTACVKYVDYFSFDDEFNFNCYDTNNQYGVSVTAKDNQTFNEKIKGFNLIFLGAGTSKPIKVLEGASTNCRAGN